MIFWPLDELTGSSLSLGTFTSDSELSDELPSIFFFISPVLASLSVSFVNSIGGSLNGFSGFMSSFRILDKSSFGISGNFSIGWTGIISDFISMLSSFVESNDMVSVSLPVTCIISFRNSIPSILCSTCCFCTSSMEANGFLSNSECCTSLMEARGFLSNSELVLISVFNGGNFFLLASSKACETLAEKMESSSLTLELSRDVIDPAPLRCDVLSTELVLWFIWSLLSFLFLFLSLILALWDFLALASRAGIGPLIVISLNNVTLIGPFWHMEISLS